MYLCGKKKQLHPTGSKLINLYSEINVNEELQSLKSKPIQFQ